MIVADTCVVIWLAESRHPAALSKRAAEAIDAARHQGGVAISDISLYELAWLVKNHRIAITASMAEFLEQVESHFVVVPVSAAIARLALELPASFPRDPMDRIIAATALDRGIPLVTADKAIRKSKVVPVVW